MGRPPMKTRHPTESDIPGLRALWKEAFGDTDAYLDCFFRFAFARERCLCTEDRGRITAALYWFDCTFRGRKIAYLYAVAVAQAYRGQGLCRHLMEDTHAHLDGYGYAGSILVPGSTSLFSLYGHLGYRTCSSVDEFFSSAAESGIPVRRIPVEEYALLRRNFLPEGAVIQEKENLDFLAAQYELFAGMDFLLAARCEKGILYAAEFLGNRSAIPSVLHALHCSRGEFRAPGDGKAFAMYYPLQNTGIPHYFGLAFD